MRRVWRRVTATWRRRNAEGGNCADGRCADNVDATVVSTLSSVTLDWSSIEKRRGGPRAAQTRLFFVIDDLPPSLSLGASRPSPASLARSIFSHFDLRWATFIASSSNDLASAQPPLSSISPSSDSSSSFFSFFLFPHQLPAVSIRLARHHLSALLSCLPLDASSFFLLLLLFLGGSRYLASMTISLADKLRRRRWWWKKNSKVSYTIWNDVTLSESRRL